MPDDPFTQVYTALWDTIFAAADPVAALVKEGNRVSVLDKEDPVKQNPQDCDMPELMLFPAPGPVGPAFTSTSAMFQQVYAVRVATGTLRAKAAIFPIKWALVRTLVKAAVAARPFGLSFVQKLEISDGGISLNDPEAEKGTAGWSLLLTVTVTFVFNKADL